MEYNEWINQLFHECAELLRIMAPYFGMSYKEINIWIFVILEPAMFLVMLIWIIILKIKLNNKK
jgi:hypothetical protein